MSYLRNVIVLIKKSWKSSALKERTNTFTIFPLKISLSEIPCFLNKKLLNALTLQSGLWWCNRPRVRSGDSIDVLAGSHEPDPRRPVNSDVHWTVQGSHFQYEYFVGNPLEKFEFSEFMKCGRLYLASSLSSEILLRRMYSRGWICFLKFFFSKYDEFRNSASRRRRIDRRSERNAFAVAVSANWRYSGSRSFWKYFLFEVSPIFMGSIVAMLKIRLFYKES